MKMTKIFIPVATIIVAFLLIQWKPIGKEPSCATAMGDTAVEYPTPVKAIIDQKCYACHNPESKSEKARNKLNWNNLPGLAKMEQVSKLDAIIETLDKGEMPPQKYIERKPEAKMTAAEIKVIKEWAQKTSDAILNKK